MEQRTSFTARAVSPRAHSRNPSPLAAAISARLRRNRAADAQRSFAAQGFAVTVHADQTFAIDCRAGCNLQVIGGRAWITAEGAPEDVFADAQSNVALARGSRFTVSALRDETTIVVTLPAHELDARFELQIENGVRTLRLTTGRHRFAEALRGLLSLIADVEDRLFAPLRLDPARTAR